MDNPTPDGLDPGEFYSTAPPAPDSIGTGPVRAQAPVAESVVRPRSGLLAHALAGLEAGIVGVLWMFGCFVVASFWDGGGIWAVPNLFSTVFYGGYAYEGEFLRSTWGGIALIIVLYGLMGAIWGCFWKEDRKPLLSFYGALAGLAVYFIFFDFIWTHADPLIPLYAPVRQLEVAHILWGAALARSPGYSRRIAMAMMQPISFSPASVSSGTQSAEAKPEPAPDEAKSVRGELIR